MDLRTKLVFALVVVSLGSMLALGTLAYTNAETLITRRTTLSLASLAETKSERVELVVSGWEEAVGLLASRTQLRRSLVEWNQTKAEVHRQQIGRILADAQAASRLVAGVVVFDVDGDSVASAGSVEPAPVVEADAAGARATLVGFTDENPPRVLYVSGLHTEDGAVGELRVLLSTDDLARVATNYTGLGETGEVLIATPDRSGGMRLLTRTRHESTESGARPGSGGLWAALEGIEEPVTRGLVDYRGQVVWAAARRIDPANLNLLVKFDEAEQRADVDELRDTLLGVGFSLSAFAILLGVALAFGFAKPIQALAVVAGRIRDGDLAARADTDRQDELGLLAETFNSMSTELERRMSMLQEYKTFFDESRDLLCIAGTDGYFKRVNPAFENELGWSEADLLGRPFVDFVHPDDVEATVQETERLARGIPTVSFSNRYRCKDGTYRRLRWSSHPDRDTGNLYASARILEDPAD